MYQVKKHTYRLVTFLKLCFRCFLNYIGVIGFPVPKRKNSHINNIYGGFKGIIHSKMKILSSFILNLY